MTGKAHAAAGACAAAALIAVIPTEVAGTQVSWPVEIGVGVLGALFPDIDVKNSKGSKLFNKALLYGVPALAIAALGLQYKTGGISQDVIIRLIAIGVFVFMGLYGKTQPHRGATHSVLFLLATTMCVAIGFSGNYYIWYGAGYASHLLLDLANTKSERLLWPFDESQKNKGFCFKLCKADGIANDVVTVASIVFTIGLLMFKIGPLFG